MASTSSKTSSPVKPATLSGFESLVQSATSNQVRMNEAMHGLWVGPMPVEQFLDDFLPLPGSAPAAPTLSSKFFAAMPVTKLEKEMYQPFVRSILCQMRMTHVIFSARSTLFAILTSSPASRSSIRPIILTTTR